MNGEHHIEMPDLSPKNQHGNDDVQNYSHTNGYSEKSDLTSSSVDSVHIHNKPSSVNTTSQDVRHLPIIQPSAEAYNSNTRNGAVLELDVEPAVDTEMIPKPHPPVARNPELDDDDEPDTKHIPNTPKDHPGVDDGFFPDIGPRVGADEPKNGQPPNNGNVPSGRRPSVNFPFAPGYDGIDPLVGGINPQIIPDVNVYQHKKTLAQGMMDLALLSANANQLRYVLESYNRHPYYYFSLVFISLSLILQIAVGVGLIMNSRYDVKKDDHICKADRINNFTILGIFLITIVNVFISSFGVADPSPETNL